MEKKLADLGIATVGDLRGFAAEELQLRFGSFGRRLHLRAQGIDERPVQPDQPVQSISAEDTFERDLTLYEFEADIRRLAEKTWLATRKTERVGRTVVLKRSEEHTSELQSLMRISYAVFCLKKKNT